MSKEALRRAVRTVPDFPSPGIAFKDITPLLASPPLLGNSVDALTQPFLTRGVTKVIGIESRGFILGAMMAHHLEAGFVPVRKQGKLPGPTRTESYALEYGTDTIEMQEDALEPGDRVLIHDDVIATGGTAAAAARLVEQSQATLIGFSFLIELTALKGKDHLPATVPTHVVLSF